MRSISSVIDHPITFLQPKLFHSKFELRFGNELIGSLDRAGITSTEMTAMTSDGCWKFRRGRFSQDEATVEDSSTGEIAGSFSSGFGKSKNIIHLPGEKDFPARLNIWRSRMVILDGKGGTIAEFREEGFLNMRYTITFYRTAARIPELPLLTMFGCYVILLAGKKV